MKDFLKRYWNNYGKEQLEAAISVIIVFGIPLLIAAFLNWLWG